MTYKAHSRADDAQKNRPLRWMRGGRSESEPIVFGHSLTLNSMFPYLRDVWGAVVPLAFQAMPLIRR